MRASQTLAMASSPSESSSRNCLRFRGMNRTSSKQRIAETELGRST